MIGLGWLQYREVILITELSSHIKECKL